MLGHGVRTFVIAASAAAPFELSWDAPAGCPTEGDVRARVEELLSGSTQATELRAVVRAHSDERGIWRVDLRFESEDGVAERTLGDASSCRAAAEAAAVVVAIAIDPELALAGVPEAPPRPADEPVADEPASQPSTTTEMGAARGGPPPRTPARIEPTATTDSRAARARPRPRGAIAIGPGVSFGTLPQSAGVGRLTGAVLWRRVRAGIGLAFAGGTPIRREGTRISLWRWTVDAHVCPVFAVGRRVEIVPCVGVEAGQTLATSRGLVAAQNPRDPWVAAFVQPAVAVLATARLAILAGGQLVVPFQRRSYLVDGLDEVFLTAPVGGGAFVALELRIP